MCGLLASVAAAASAVAPAIYTFVARNLAQKKEADDRDKTVVAALKDLGDKMDKLSAKVDAKTDKLSDKVDANHKEMGAKLDKLSDKMDAGFTRVNDKLDDNAKEAREAAALLRSRIDKGGIP